MSFLVSSKVVAVVFIAIVVVSGLLYFQAAREKEAIQRLEMKIVDVSVSRLGLSSGDITIRLKFVNPSDYDTPTFWINNYSIYINGELVGTGSMPPTKVVANSSIYQDLAITVEYSKISKALINAILMRKLQVEIKGEIKAKILFGLLEISTPFTSTYSLG